ncbi:Rop guanine nucleotide exchange factor 1 [Linum perenne]
MMSLSSEDDGDRFDLDSYNLSADISESESGSSCVSSSCHNCNHSRVGSTSLTSSSSAPFAEPPEFDDRYRPVTLMPPVVSGRHVVIQPKKAMSELSETELMKERFAKLLLGEDMSGGGNGVCTALAISNAITNLSASVFGQLWKLEPLPEQKKAMWRREMEWLLCLSDSIVELVPSVQDFPGGGTFEVMVPQPRSDLYVNVPALKKLDAMLLSVLDGFTDSEFCYVERGGIAVAGDGETKNFMSSLTSGTERSSVRLDEKWWLPFPKVPQIGLSENTRKTLQQCRECTSQILKAAMAINNNVLAEMEIPNSYLDGLPKNAEACLGEKIHGYLAADNFSPDSLLDYLDLSPEFTTLEVANRIEAASHTWNQKYHRKYIAGGVRSTTWTGKLKHESPKCKMLAARAENLLRCLRLRFPDLPQTSLDMSKIQHNRDVGRAIIESYSRVMESLAFNIMARIEDLLYVDDATKQRAVDAAAELLYTEGRLSCSFAKQRWISPSQLTLDHSGELVRYSKNGSSSPEFTRKSSNNRESVDEALEKLSC